MTPPTPVASEEARGRALASSDATFWCERAWLDGGPVAEVRVEARDGRIVAVRPGARPQPGDTRLDGVVLPGFADAHSHAFHRALRGRTHAPDPAGPGSFWTWRRTMYALAGSLTPETYERLATALYAEMALAGVTAVGEFHYLHHDPAGRRYADPNEMAWALRRAAATAGIRLTLLDACYLAGGVGAPLEGAQVRFSDGSAEAWASRADALVAAAGSGHDEPDGFRVGAAIHSVRAVPRDQLPTVAAWARAAGAPLHVHLSEQPAENEACRAAYGATPTAVLADAGAWGPDTTAVHAVHLTDGDVALLGAAHATVCACPSTERDLGDGLAPNARLLAAGCALAVGSDQHVQVDLLAEARAVEEHERLAGLARGVLAPADLVTALTAAGHAALGSPSGGRLAVGAPADLVAVALDTPRTAGVDPAQVVTAATAADVTTVVVGGRTVVERGRHALGDVGALLASAVAAAYDEAAR